MTRFKFIIFTVSLMMMVTTQASPTETHIRQMLSGVTITSVKPAPISGWYVVTTPKTVFYVDASARYVMFGHLYDFVTRQDLTTTTLKTLKTLPAHSPVIEGPKIAWHDLPHQAAIQQGPKKAPTFAVFLDPDCPYCRQLAMDLNHQTHYRIEYYLMPLDSLHPGASTKAQQILCSPQPYDALASAMVENKPLNTPLCNTPQLTAVEQFAKAHQFFGTPILIRRDGAMHMGYLPPANLSAWLNKGGAPA